MKVLTYPKKKKKNRRREEVPLTKLFEPWMLCTFSYIKAYTRFFVFLFSEFVLLAGCRCIGTCTSNYGKSVPKLIMGNSIQCCCHPHCRWSTPSTIWFCHDAFTFRSAICIVLLLNPSYSLIGMVKKANVHCSMRISWTCLAYIYYSTTYHFTGPTNYSFPVSWKIHSYVWFNRWPDGSELNICCHQLVASTAPWVSEKQ